MSVHEHDDAVARCAQVFADPAQQIPEGWVHNQMVIVPHLLLRACEAAGVAADLRQLQARAAAAVAAQPVLASRETSR